MGNFIDLTGQKFERLLVIKKANKTDKSKSVYWTCNCDCGNKNLEIRGQDLRNGNTKSCGCLQKELLKARSQKKNIWEELPNGVIKGITNNYDGIEFYISKDDFEKVKNICWYADYDSHINDYYICTYKNSKYIALHRFIMDMVDDKKYLVDHINHNTRDNTRHNLRISSSSCNSMNRKLMNNNTSGITGVTWHHTTQKWQVRICVNGKSIYLGVYDDFDSAVKVRKDAEEKYFGEFSYNNSVKEK